MFLKNRGENQKHRCRAAVFNTVLTGLTFINSFFSRQGRRWNGIISQLMDFDTPGAAIFKIAIYLWHPPLLLYQKA